MTRRVAITGAGAVSAIVFTTQSMGVIPVDQAGNVLHPNITWVDGRAEDQALAAIDGVVRLEVQAELVVLAVRGFQDERVRSEAGHAGAGVSGRRGHPRITAHRCGKNRGAQEPRCTAKKRRWVARSSASPKAPVIVPSKNRMGVWTRKLVIFL